jgi:DNA-binding transcriptional MerR regulator
MFMKIKEIEQKSGMDRSSIRFYEKEGLIQPERMENGYREYDEDDLEILLRIKLLRSIHVELEDIRLLFEGKKSLARLLDDQILVLEDEKSDMEFAQEICRRMKHEETSIVDLDAAKYLEPLERKTASTGTRYFTQKRDQMPQVFSPWRRFLARWIDYSLYSLLWEAFLVLLLHVNISTRGIS